MVQIECKESSVQQSAASEFCCWTSGNYPKCFLFCISSTCWTGKRIIFCQGKCLRKIEIMCRNVRTTLGASENDFWVCKSYTVVACLIGKPKNWFSCDIPSTNIKISILQQWHRSKRADVFKIWRLLLIDINHWKWNFILE